MTSKLVIVAMVVLVMGGCTTLSASGPVNVNPLSANGRQWSISAKAVTGNWDDEVSLYINDAKVASGTLTPSNHNDVQITGGYGEHIILGVCSRSSGNPLTYHCDVFVDGTKTTTLNWSGDN